MGQKIKDKVKLEREIDYYLENDIPISLLTEKYDLTYRQIGLLISRIAGYEKQSGVLGKKIDYSGPYSTEQLIHPHIMDEEYPIKHEDGIELFLRFNLLKRILNTDNGQSQIKARKKYDKLQLSLKEYDKYLEDFSKIKLFLKAFDEIRAKKTLTDFEIAQLAFKQGLNLFDVERLYEKYVEYLKILAQLDDLKTEIKYYESFSTPVGEERKKYEKEYKEIRDKLINVNVKLVNWCIRRFFNTIPLPKEDAMSVGIEGLIKAVDTFECRKRDESGDYIHFSTYAVVVIKHTIQLHFSELIGISWPDFVNKTKIESNREAILALSSSKKAVSPEELSSTGLIPLSPSKIADLDEIPFREEPFSVVNSSQEEKMDEEIPPYGSRKSYIDIESLYKAQDEYLDATEVVDPTNPIDTVESKIGYEQALSIIKAANLTEREKEVLMLRYGIEDGKEWKYEDIGKIFKVTGERVRQIEARALRRLRHPSNAKKLRDLYIYSYQDGTDNKIIK